MERWAEWRKCHEVNDFVPLIASGVHRTFRAVSERITAYAEDVVAGLMPLQFQRPEIDKSAVTEAMGRYLSERSEVQRPSLWFENPNAARAYVRTTSSQPPRAAYWPGLRLTRAFDAAWHGDGFDPRVRNHLPALEGYEDLDWLNWTTNVPLVRDRGDSEADLKRYERLQNLAVALADSPNGQSLEGRSDVSAIDIQALSPFTPPMGMWTPLTEAFAAGLFYFWVGPTEIVCIPRPSLWIADGQLHRADGPAVAWSTGESHYFWRGVGVPNWVIEEPQKITPKVIDGEANLERRRCLIERFGEEAYLRFRGAEPIDEDRYGRLWGLPINGRRLLEVDNGTPDPDGTRRKYFLSVPPSVQSAHEAVAWTYGLRPEQYDITKRT
jgi:hypothetical protein